MVQAAERLVLVIGATGTQGGAVAERLLRDGGWRLRALTRDSQGEGARALAARGIEVARGDMDDPASLDAAMGGAYGVFFIPIVGRGVDAEVRGGMNVAEAARRAGVRHLVFSGVSGGNRKIGVPNFESKGAIEEHIRSRGVPHTILRPVSFMENFNRNRDAIKAGRLSGILSPHRPQWLIAVKNIADFAVAAFGQPEKFLGQAIDLAGDTMTLPQVAKTFSRVLGRPVEYRFIPPAERDGIAEAMKVMNEFYEREGYGVDIPALRARWGIPLMTLEEWVRQAGWTAA